ncbi:putative chloramphenical resistance permease RarD [Actinomyces denticolens]|nr:putative chloramphenical resistance permease RarD [Actinomyces denticolens]
MGARMAHDGHAMSIEPSPARSPAPAATGLMMVLGCYLLWGIFPLYFHLLAAAGSLEIIGHRILWTLATCLIAVALLRRWDRLRAALTAPRLAGSLVVSGLIITLNWLIYVYGVNSGRTADAALGYFINPLVTVALAAVFLGERLRRLQLAALALAGLGVLVLVVAQGALPWVSLGLAGTFGLYGLAKKRSGAHVDALTGLTVESLAMAPLAVAYLGCLAAQGRTVFQGAQASPGIGALLLIAGPVTAVPLLLFAAGARRVALTTIGMVQYLGPILQFLLAWLVFHEEISTARWAAMALVWAAVAVFVIDLVAQIRKQPGRARP